MNSMAPMSTPRVGWPTSSTRGRAPISRASTSFCWLPPENLDAAQARSRGRTSNRSIIARRRVAHRGVPVQAAPL
jgi:hypothetical protein